MNFDQPILGHVSAITYLYLHDGDHCTVEPTTDGKVRLSHDAGSVRFDPALARTVGTRLLAAAENATEAKGAQ